MRWVFAAGLPVLTAIGAYHLMWASPVLVIVATIAVVILYSMGRIKNPYPYLFGLSLSFIWQTTMMGVDVVGSDIHTELFYAQRALNQGWDVTYPDSSNSSIVVGLLIPLLSKSMFIPVAWVMKVVIPIFLACVPLVLFASFKEIFDGQKAFYATIFFMIVPVFSIEIAQIEKSMVAELFMAIMFYCLVNDWKWQYKLPCIAISLSLAILSHYTVGLISLCFLLCVFGWRLISARFYKFQWLSNSKTPLLVILASLLIGMGVFYSYHSYAANGSAWRSVKDIAVPYFPKSIVPDSTDKEIIVRGSNPNIPLVEAPIERRNITDSVNITGDKQPTLVKTGLGMDFANVPLDAQVFRVIQYLTQLLIVMGGIWLLIRYRSMPQEYLGLLGGAVVMLLACIIMPSIAMILNMTRFYHYALFFISPLFVLGIECAVVTFEEMLQI